MFTDNEKDLRSSKNVASSSSTESKSDVNLSNVTVSKQSREWGTAQRPAGVRAVSFKVCATCRCMRAGWAGKSPANGDAMDDSG